MSSEKKYLLKYATDKVLVAIFILLLSPLMTAIFIAIWIEGLFCKDSKGAAIYRETRISQGKPFIIYKFRVLKQCVIEKMTESDSATFLQANPENVTRTGKILIKFYFDELPQLFNILSGQMSLVGPRPRISLVYQSDLKNGYVALKFLRGGITGPHQLSKGTPDLSLHRSEEYYNRCKTYAPLKLLIYDLSIILRSPLKIAKAEGL